MVIDHHQIGRHCVAPRLHDEAVLVVRTLLAETVFARRGGVIPDRRIFGNFQTFRLVAALRHLGKNRDAARIGGVFAGQETTVGQRPFKVVGANVIRPPLEQRDLHRRLQGIANHRQILVEQLILKGFRAGGNDHLAVGTQRRHQIGEGLARAGSRLGNEDRTAIDGGSNALGHVDLLLAHAIAADRLRQRAVERKYFRKGGQGKAPEKSGQILTDGSSFPGSPSNLRTMA